ncbi:hypothetical protein C0993_006974 [Termitomyces sp. T159_Od127]|nr:hypothetical protein C0993_006974 [Termitomyces sp. T159_Od127]
MFVSDQLNLTHNSLDKLLELQLFDGKPTTAGPITKTHSSSIVLDNGLWFLVNLLIMQLLDTTSIMLGLPWLHDFNLDIDWRDFTMKFPGPGACLTAIHLCLQPTNNSNEVRATGTLTALMDDFDNSSPL